jgi:predicted dienelactone hydrolase
MPEEDSRMIRKLALRSVVAAAVVFGLVAQAGSYLLAFTPGPVAPLEVSATGGAAYAEPGPNPVGLRWLAGDEDNPRLTVWYPASIEGEGRPLSYSYGMHMFGPGNVTALAVDAGRAQPGAAAASTGPYPVVVLSHGFAISASSYAWIAEHLASHGMVVVAPHHDETLNPNALWKATFDRLEDVEAAVSLVTIATESGGELDGLVDTDTVAVIGHSYGGYTAMAAAGARLDTGAFETSCVSAASLEFMCGALIPRLEDLAVRAGLDDIPSGLWPAFSDHVEVDAAVSLAGDAAMFGEEGLAEVSVPMMAIGGTADIDSPFEWGTEYPYEHVSSDRKVEIGIEGAAHFVFAGGCGTVRRILTVVPMGFCSDPEWDRSHAQNLVRHFVTAFLLAELRIDEAAADALTVEGSQHPGITYRSEGY